MRTTHLSVVHRPLDNRIFEKECRALVADGHEVHLVVAAPPAARLDGVRLHSLAGTAGRPRARHQPLLQLRAARWAVALRPSVYHLHDPHLIPLGLLLKTAGARVVYDVHEDYPAHARSKLLGHPLRARAKAALWRALEAAARRSFDRFVCASDALAGCFPEASTVVVGNFPALDAFVANGAPPYSERPNTLIYTGVISAIRGAPEMIRALELLPDDLECRLRLVGEWRPRSLDRLLPESSARDRIDFSPWRRHGGLLAELASARVGLIPLRPVPNHEDPARSNKLFEYMAAGLPVVGPDIPRWRELLEGAGCGVAVDTRDPAAIAAAIERLLRDPEEAGAMGRRGRRAVRERFNWDGDRQRLLSLYRDLAR